MIAVVESTDGRACGIAVFLEDQDEAAKRMFVAICVEDGMQDGNNDLAKVRGLVAEAKGLWDNGTREWDKGGSYVYVVEGDCVTLPPVQLTPGELRDQMMAEQATGSRACGQYVQWLKQRGYLHYEQIDMTSSAGDWSFAVSVDGSQWFVMTQANNHPRAGFTRRVDRSDYFRGTGDEAVQFFCGQCGS